MDPFGARLGLAPSQTFAERTGRYGVVVPIDTAGIRATRFVQLFHQSRARALLALCETDSADPETPPMRSLHFRREDEAKYRCVLRGAPSGNPLSVVCAQTAPVAYARLIVRSRTHKWGWNNGPIVAIDLEHGRPRTVLDDDTLDRVGLRKDVSGSWISRLISVSANGKQLYCSVAIPRPVPEGTVIDYWLARVHVDTGRWRKLTRLEGIGF